MKNLMLIIVSLLSIQFLIAQDVQEATASIQKTENVDAISSAKPAWEMALKTQLDAAKQAREIDQLKNVTATIERIALSQPGEWLPNYYAAYYNSQIFWRGGEETCGKCLKQMDNFLKIAEKAEENSEVMTLRANYWQSQLQVSSMMAPFYGPKAGKILNKAIKKDGENPRAYYLLAQNIFYTPAMFGGGKEKAMPYFEKAKELFAKQAEDENSLLPSWGKRNMEILEKQLTK